jgi:hypothetical protein
MTMRRRLLVLITAFASACGSRAEDDPPSMYEGIEIEPALATLTLPLGGSVTQAYTVYGVANGYAKHDITASCTLTIDATFGRFADATVTVQSRGGKTPIVASCDGLTGQAQLVVNLSGAVVVPGAPDNAPDLFGAATDATNPARTPAIQYPIDRAVSPRNIPPIETQWTAAGNDLFHLTIASELVSVDVYAPTPAATLDAGPWRTIAETAAGDTLRFTVEGLAQAAPENKFASSMTTITMSTDTIDNTAIYYWASDQGQVMSQVFGAPEPPSVVKGNCTSCHTVSRSGSRIGYSRCINNLCGNNNLAVGFLTYDSATQTWTENVNADNLAIRGSYLSFAPVGNPFPDDTRAVAAVTRNNGTMALYDADTGAEVPSNLAVANITDATMTHSALMPDWSSDGNTVVYTSAYPGQWIDLTNGRIATMSYSYAGGAHTFGTPQLIVSDPITLANGTYNNFFFPSFSPDNQVIVFNAARSQWRSAGTYARDAGQRLMLTTPTGAWKQDLTAANGGLVDADVTWAHWAPTVSNEYYWIVFSSERDYGHRTTQATSPASCKQNKVQQCKQIWLTAIARNKLNGTIDPSAPPMWLPGQAPLANNISPYWSRPAVIQ